MKTYILTGGTGYLGSALAKRLLEQGNKIIFIGRGKDNIPFKERVYRKIENNEKNKFSKSVVTIEADITDSKIIGKQEFSKYKNKVDGLLHLAANLSFKKRDKENVFKTNIEGTKNMLELSKFLNCNFYYVSTAYVHGKKPGICYEEKLKDDGRKFNNYYEESKFISEKEIYKWGEKNDKKFVIFRPSILVGGDFISTKFFGYYSVLYPFFKLKKVLEEINNRNIFLLNRIFRSKNGKSRIPILWLVSKGSTLNLVYLDSVIDVIDEVLKKKKNNGKIFHITNPVPPSMKIVMKESLNAMHMDFPVLEINSFFVNIFMILISQLLSFFGFTKPLSKILNTYRYYMTKSNEYDLKNLKMVMGDKINDIISIHKKENFVYELAKDFVVNLEK
ncbi:MAG: male sterility domain protein [Parcubacteria group bacterium Athens0714_16]|nr:MAG: male sterility domain protein [Parcubacteria group bacterium Athens0714_16]